MIKTNREVKCVKPVYDNKVVYKLEGDFNDADYTYCEIYSDPESFDIIMNVLESCSGKDWEDSDPVEMGIDELTNLGIEDDSPIYKDVLRALEDISLYGPHEPCHTMEIEDVHFECKDDCIRYNVEF